METVQANQLLLQDLTDKFALHRTNDEQFFTEWLTDLPQISDLEKEVLDRIKQNYLYLNERTSTSESIVKMVVLSPLMEMAGFYQPPFEISGETAVEISVEDEDRTIKGKIDILIVRHQLWMLAIESKRSAIASTSAIPKILTYMLANPNPDQQMFGLVTNGYSFIFLKLVRQDLPVYDLSNEFSLINRGNDLYQVFPILKRLGTAIDS